MFRWINRRIAMFMGIGSPDYLKGLGADSRPWVHARLLLLLAAFVQYFALGVVVVQGVNVPTGAFVLAIATVPAGYAMYFARQIKQFLESRKVSEDAEPAPAPIESPLNDEGFLTKCRQLVKIVAVYVLVLITAYLGTLK